MIVSIFFSLEEDAIDDVIASLRTGRQVKGVQSKDGLMKFKLNVEEDYAGFLGIDIVKKDDGTIELLQTGLIDRILAVLDLDGERVATKATPALTETLGKDIDGPPRKDLWNYASVVGMMLYLASNSRPDIAFAVHQSARFTHCAKLVHEQAIKRIARYLKGTRDKGLRFQPTKDLSLELYADADFAGLWNSEDSQDPTCVKSRSGHVVTIGGVPVGNTALV